MITVKGKADADWAIISHIIDPSTPNVEFKNVTFDCKTIKDASGHIFVRQKERTMSNKSIYQAMTEARLRLREYNVDLSNYSYKMTKETFEKLKHEVDPWGRFTALIRPDGRQDGTMYGIQIEIVDDAVELSPKGENHG